MRQIFQSGFLLDQQRYGRPYDIAKRPDLVRIAADANDADAPAVDDDRFVGAFFSKRLSSHTSTICPVANALTAPW